MKEFIPAGEEENNFTGQIEVLAHTVQRRIYYVLHTQNQLWSIQIKHVVFFSERIESLKHELDGESCCFVLKSNESFLVVTSKDCYVLKPLQMMQRVHTKYHSTSFKTFIEMYTRYRKSNEKNISFTTPFMKRTNDFSAFISTTTFPLIEPKYQDTLPESRIKRPIIHTLELGTTYFYIFVLKAIIWICNSERIIQSLDAKGTPYENMLIDSDLVYFVSDQRISVLDFNLSHPTLLVESLKSLKTPHILNLRRLEKDTYVDDTTFELYNITYNPQYFVEHLFSPSPYRMTFLHMLFTHNISLSKEKDDEYAIISLLPQKFENITADYLIDFLTHAIPAEIRRFGYRDLRPKNMTNYFNALFYFSISFDVKSINKQNEIVDSRLPLFGRLSIDKLSTDKRDRIKLPMDKMNWEKEFKKCLNLIFLHSFPDEGQNLKGQDLFVPKYCEILNCCLSHCYNNFEKYIKEKYQSNYYNNYQINSFEDRSKFSFNLILEKIHFYACIQDCLSQFGIQAKQQENVDSLVIDAFKILPFRIFSQCILSGSLQLSPNAYRKILKDYEKLAKKHIDIEQMEPLRALSALKMDFVNEELDPNELSTLSTVSSRFTPTKQIPRKSSLKSIPRKNSTNLGSSLKLSEFVVDTSNELKKENLTTNEMNESKENDKEKENINLNESKKEKECSHNYQKNQLIQMKIMKNVILTTIVIDKH